MTEAKTEAPISAGFVRVISGKPAPHARSLIDMDFPTLDELEMDVPILNAHMQQARIAPEDDEDLDMQYLLHFRPDFGQGLEAQ